MKVGLFGARADDRGLGRLTHDFYRHMTPDRTVVIDMGPHARQFTQHFGRYPDTTVIPFNGGALDVEMMRRFFDGLDVAVCYETAYDHRAYDIARSVDCRTVLMTMPEFHRHLTEELPQPDVVWVPTTWRLDTLPAGTRVVPAPVTLHTPATKTSGPLRVLHVAGHRAASDRNGTLPFLRALRLVRGPVTVRITTQDRRLPNIHGIPRHLPVAVDLGGVDDYRRLYDHADVIVMPRRYGGLCLPVAEALAGGLAVVMTDCEPNPDTWPIAPITCRPGATIRTPAGPVVLNDPDPADIAAVIVRLAANPTELAELKERARTWAEANTWEALAPLYRSELARAFTQSPVAA